MRETTLFALTVFLSIGSLACGGTGDAGNSNDVDNTDLVGGDDSLGERPCAPLDGFRPGKRSDLTGIADPVAGTIVFFGGDNGPTINQETLHVFHDDTWILTPGSGWENVATDLRPSPRGRGAVAYDPGGRRMLLFGGRWVEPNTAAFISYEFTRYNDLWAFDLDAHTWSLLHDGTGTAPSARYGAAAAFDPLTNVFYIYGGSPRNGEVWAFGGESWGQVNPEGSGPSSATVLSGYTYDPSRNRLLVMGGMDLFSGRSLNVLHALDLNGGWSWSLLHSGNGYAPAGRFSGALAYDENTDRYFSSTGHGDFFVMNDLWSFDPTENAWSEMANADEVLSTNLGCLGNQREIPNGNIVEDLSAPERRSSALFLMLHGTPWVFGGESDCSEHLDDVWCYGSGWVEVFEARTGEGCARRGDACSCMCL